ncbi:MAG: DUF4846 domain-containing protein [Saprospiraceae bacterium]|nr:DUF4846 domain-containing protein [Saprospiraceae bacterium]MCF8248624.1 DUF4846 domain-containing protein [Saprospiraceae bacterium]MCF8282970.1 DUF4846 domain-containing protein [Bacteroidales bacterium]MCF8310357.1 DUF4846 domain-containing protein [Saprospiraceae bacterium]MCF8442062.1 DUF4846 domain-containing protein [Saprospiraceae bacterium]
MKTTFTFTIPFLQVLVGCQSPQSQPQQAVQFVSQSIDNQEGKTIAERFQPLDGYLRKEAPANSFSNYLRNLPLKPANAQVHLYDGSLKSRQSAHAAVVDMDTGDRNLQQCADAIMRLRAEYLFAQKQYDQLHFNFTNGFNAEYAKWRQGQRVKIEGNRTTWYATNSPSTSYESFRKYLDLVFMYAGTLSLSKELKPKQLKNLEIGDVFIQGGSPGHAVIVVDVALKSSTGEKVFMLAQSYMPAQEIHVLKNPNDLVMSPWYSADFGDELVTPEWTFEWGMLSSF